MTFHYKNMTKAQVFQPAVPKFLILHQPLPCCVTAGNFSTHLFSFMIICTAVYLGARTLSARCYKRDREQVPLEKAESLQLGNWDGQWETSDKQWS